MRGLLLALLTVTVLALGLTIFMHASSANHFFLLVFVENGAPGKLERQRYVQFTNEPGTLLFGYRHQKIDGVGDLPTVSLDFKADTRQDAARRKEPKEGKAPDYFLGFHKETSGEPNADFYGSYLDVRFWVFETLLIILTLFWIVLLIFVPGRHRGDYGTHRSVLFR